LPEIKDFKGDIETMEEQKAIDRVAIPENPYLTEEDGFNEDNWTLIPEVVGFGWNSEEEERDFLLEEFGPEWVEENWKPWAEREKEMEA
jgi:hypothetical protein